MSLDLWFASFLAYSCRIMEFFSIFRGTCFSISMKHRKKSFKYQSCHKQNHCKIGLHNGSFEIFNAVADFCIELLNLPVFAWVKQLSRASCCERNNPKCIPETELPGKQLKHDTTGLIFFMFSYESWRNMVMLSAGTY